MKKLVFEDDYGKIEVNIEGFITDFKKLLILISTCNYTVANALFKSEHEGQNIFQVNYEYAEKNGMVKFWDWQMKEGVTNRHVKSVTSSFAITLLILLPLLMFQSLTLSL